MVPNVIPDYGTSLRTNGLAPSGASKKIAQNMGSVEKAGRGGAAGLLQWYWSRRPAHGPAKPQCTKTAPLRIGLL